MQPLRKMVCRFLRKLKTELPYDPAIPPLGVYLDKTTIQKETSISRFTAALFTTAKTQPKCSSTAEWINKMWYVHTMEHCSAIKKNTICSNVDAIRDYHSKSEKERQIPYDITYKWNLKYDTNELIYKTEINSPTERTD